MTQPRLAQVGDFADPVPPEVRLVRIWFSCDRHRASEGSLKDQADDPG